MLANYRILDLCDERGVFAGALLAQLGAEVVLVEPPEGSPTRHCQPFVGDEAGVERSLHHLGFNRGKRSVVIDWSTPEGWAEFDELLASADAVLMSGRALDHRRRGLPGPSELVARYPQLVVANVSGFGLIGPKAGWADSDLVCGAAGFQQSVTGNFDRAPLRTAVPQVFLSAAADAVVGVLIALAERESGSGHPAGQGHPSGHGPGSGQGQLIDISAQESWIWAGFYLAYSGPWESPVSHRCGAAPKTGPLTTRFDFPAADGHVTITLMTGAAVGPFTNRLVEWMVEENQCPAELADTDWANFDPFSDPTRLDRLNEAVGLFTATKTRSDLMVGARERRLLLAPVLTIDDVLAAPQFVERGLWRAVELDDGRTLSTPGPFALCTPDPLPEVGPAPHLGADTDRIGSRPATNLGPAPTAESDPVALDPADPTHASFPAAELMREGPLGGLRVLDLTTSYAGPLIGRTLAGFGATVVKVESARRPDLARTSPPFLGDGFECSAAYAHTNAAKLSIALDLSRPEARPVLFDLAAWADVIIDAYAPGALARMGLDRDTLARLNPSAVVCQTTMLGQSGPLADVPGYGNMATALTGFFAATGWPDRGPVGPVGAYTDMISPRFAGAVVLAALDQRRRTGKGSWIDLGQGEACLQLLTLGFLDVQANGRSYEGQGNADHTMAPHGVYPAAGDDRWIAISCVDDDQWQALAAELDRSDLAPLTGTQRRARRDELDEIIIRWSSGLDEEEAQARLQAVGVAAHRVQNSPDCLSDPHLQARGWVVDVPHPVMDMIPVGTSPVRLARTPASIPTAGPTLGQHTFEVLTELLGYDPDRIADLAVAEILE
ncbi:MAG: CoA transferase [Actinomycetia bacterium]|nr:CoA transferase [Actinomycetes bacterium]